MQGALKPVSAPTHLAFRISKPPLKDNWQTTARSDYLQLPDGWRLEAIPVLR
jgi:hypothetical protein